MYFYVYTKDIRCELWQLRYDASARHMDNPVQRLGINLERLQILVSGPILDIHCLP